MLFDEVGVGVGGSVAGGLVGCGVTVCRGVAVPSGDGVTVGTGERCGVRRGAGRFACDGVGDGELDCCAAAGESLAVPGSGGLTQVYSTSVPRKTARSIQVEVRTRRISRLRWFRRFPRWPAG